jgi:hypothetical protein
MRELSAAEQRYQAVMAVIRVCPASCACHSVSEGAASNSQDAGGRGLSTKNITLAVVAHYFESR